MNTTYSVVFRCYENQDPQWEAYGIHEAVYGSGSTLREAKEDIAGALALLTDVPVETVQLQEFHERLIRKADAQYPDIWVRILHDAGNFDQTSQRRHVAEFIKQQLDSHPSRVHTFDNGTASTGDIIAYVALPGDKLSDVLDQVGDADRIYLCMPHGEVLQWQTVFTREAENQPQHAEAIADLPLSERCTVQEFMETTHANEQQAENFLVAA